MTMPLPPELETLRRGVRFRDALPLLTAVLDQPPETLSPEVAAEACRLGLATMTPLAAAVIWPHLQAAAARPEIRLALHRELSATVAPFLEPDLAPQVRGLRPRVPLLEWHLACGGRIEPEAWVRLLANFPSLMQDPGFVRLAHRRDVPIEAVVPHLHLLWTQSGSKSDALEAFLSSGPRALDFLRHPSVRAFLLKRMRGSQSIIASGHGVGASAFAYLWAATMTAAEWPALLDALSIEGRVPQPAATSFLMSLSRFVEEMAPAVRAACPAHHPVLGSLAAACHHLPPGADPRRVMGRDYLVGQLQKLETAIGQPIPADVEDLGRILRRTCPRGVVSHNNIGELFHAIHEYVKTISPEAERALPVDDPILGQMATICDLTAAEDAQAHPNVVTNTVKLRALEARLGRPIPRVPVPRAPVRARGRR